MDQILLEIEKLTKNTQKYKLSTWQKWKKKLKKNGYNVGMDVFHVIFLDGFHTICAPKIEKFMIFKKIIRKKWWLCYKKW